MGKSEKRSLWKFLIPGLQDLVFWAPFYLVLVLGSLLFGDGDPGRHMTLGRYMLETGKIPMQDVFTYTTQGIYLPPYEWLAQILFALAYRLLGLGGVVWLIACLLGATHVLVYRFIKSQGVSSLTALLVTGWVSLVTMVHWTARPHIFSFVFYALLLPWLWRLSKGEKISLWRFFVLMLLWVNTHGAAFILAFSIWLALIVGNVAENWLKHGRINNPILQKLLASAAVALAATFLNPSGWKLWQFVLDYMRSPYLIEIAGETASVAFHTIQGWPFLLTLMISIVLISRSAQKSLLSESFLIAGWSALGLYGWRNIPLYALVVLPLLSTRVNAALQIFPWFGSLSRKIDDVENHLRPGLWLMVAPVLFAVLLSRGATFDAYQKPYQFNPNKFPVAAAAWLEEHPQEGNVFNLFFWGGYLEYRLWPAFPVFIDGQMIYVEKLVQDYEHIINAEPGWEKVTDAYEIQWMLVPPSARIVSDIQTYQLPNWQVLYQDDTAVILRRK